MNRKAYEWSRDLRHDVEKHVHTGHGTTLQEWARCSYLTKLCLCGTPNQFSPLCSRPDRVPTSRALAEAFPSLTTLIFNCYNLEVIPPAVFMLSSLRKLKMPECEISFVHHDDELRDYSPCPSLTLRDLHGNMLRQLPAELYTIFPSLTKLNSSLNEIRTLPDSLCTLSGLKHLNLDGNADLYALPKRISTLTRLHTLSLLECFLDPIPLAVFALPSLTHLSLPRWEFDDRITLDTINQLAPLKRLQIFQQPLFDWPDLSRFTNLISINLGAIQSENEFPVALLDLTGLQRLHLIGSSHSTTSYLPEPLPRYPIGCQSSLTALKLERMIMRSHLPNWHSLSQDSNSFIYSI